MSYAIRIHETGGPEVLRLEQVEIGEPGPGEARVRHTYVAVNFIDVYFRTGRYPMPLPNGLGSDAVGVVEAVGPGVTDIRPGDRVGYLLGPQGAYSDVRVMPADVLIPIPEGVRDSTAATLMMKGMTAQYLFRQVYPLKGGETILYHAAAGGVGLIASQLARALGVTMIGTVSTDEKAEIARASLSMAAIRAAQSRSSRPIGATERTRGSRAPSSVCQCSATWSRRPGTIRTVAPDIPAYSAAMRRPRWPATRFGAKPFWASVSLAEV